MSIDKILLVNRKNFDRWNQQLEEHLNTQANISEISNEEHERVFFQTNELLMSIASNFFTFGRFKDHWDTSKCHLNVYGQHLLLKSEKMDLTFNWGVDRSGFYLEAYLINVENLRYMNDEFWSMILELKGLGYFEFQGMGSLTSEERPYFENKISTVFQIIRSFMLYQVEKMNGSNYQQPPQMEIGSFLLRWDFESDWNMLLEKTCKAFKLLYSLNYHLWKISDLFSKKP